MPRPLIGITTRRSEAPEPEFACDRGYIEALRRAGAIPVLIPLGLEEGPLEELLQRLDGLLLSGGGDLAPAAYGAPARAPLRSVDPDRDRTELALVRRAAEAGTPLLGICRGLQVLNVAFGGSLIQDIQSERPGSIQHDWPDAEPAPAAHRVRVEPDTFLGRLISTDELDTNSHHHQAVEGLGAGLLASAHAPDGILEAVEITGHPFGLAVQWHPERMPDTASSRALFRAFADAARRS